MRGTKKTAAALVAGAAILAVPGATFAASHAAGGKNAQQAKPQRSLLLGSLSALSTAQVVVNVAGGSATTLSVGGYTRYLAHTQAAAIAGLKTGEAVAVSAVTTSAGTQARVVEYDTVPFGVPARVAGTITGGTPGSSITVTTASGAVVTAQLNGNTKYAVNGTKVSGLTAIPTNQAAVVSVLQMTSGGTVATAVSLGQAPTKAQRVVVRGTVASVQGSVVSVTVKKNAAPVQVQVTSSTRYIVGGKLASAAPSLTSNQRVVIVATKQTDGSLVADTVAVR